MKKIQCLIISLLLLQFSTFAQEGWFWQNPLPTGNSLKAVNFVNENVGWAVGDFGTIVKTVNGGEDWVLQKCNLTNDFYGVYFIDSVNGFVVGGHPRYSSDLSGIILKTSNGGETWEIKSDETTKWNCSRITRYNSYYK
jgi:photosystem II stability/assembly factor-like uncharacterized protein